ncbi:MULTISPECIES: DUF2271 domain-containing protein [Chitinophagaceae]
MNSRYIFALCTLLVIVLGTFAGKAQNAKYKCMVQMNSYHGDAAYVVISLVNSKDGYERTLYVLGNDKKWYKSLKEWYKFYQKQNSSTISAVTGASISGGDRTMKVIDIDEYLLDKGYKIRFESVVEDQNYQKTDVEVPLTTEALKGKTDGTGYIKFVRFNKIG